MASLEAELSLHEAISAHGERDEAARAAYVSRAIVREVSMAQGVGVSASAPMAVSLLDGDGDFDDGFGSDEDGQGGSSLNVAGSGGDSKVIAEKAKKQSAWTIRAFLGIPPGPLTVPVIVWLILRIIFLGVLFWMWTVFLNEDELRNSAWVLIMGLVAVMIPSGGAPVAGGVLFFPLLKTFAGFKPRQAVMFSASCQAIGIFVLTPINWLVRSPAVFSKPIILLQTLPATAVTVIALYLLPSNDTVKLTTEIVFAVFCMYLAWSVSMGIFKGNLLAQNGEFKVRGCCGVSLPPPVYCR